MPDMPVIGFLNSASQDGMRDFADEFLGGVRDEGLRPESPDQDVRIEWKWANGDYGQLQSLATDLANVVGIKVLATTGGFVSAKAAMQATHGHGKPSLPILFITGTKPAGLVFAGTPSMGTRHGPPQNATGVDVSGTDYIQPRLTRFRQLVPNANKIALLVRDLTPPTDISSLERETWAPRLNLHVFGATDENSLSTAFSSMQQQGIDGLLVSADPFFTSKRATIVDLATRNNLPAAYPWKEYVSSGGLMSYGASLPDAYNQVGHYAGQIVKGAQVQNLPIIVEVPERLVINERTAEALGLTPLPDSLRAASEII